MFDYFVRLMLKGLRKELKILVGKQEKRRRAGVLFLYRKITGFVYDQFKQNKGILEIVYMSEVNKFWSNLTNFGLLFRPYRFRSIDLHCKSIDLFKKLVVNELTIKNRTTSFITPWTRGVN